MTERTASEARTRAIQRVLLVTFLLNLVVAAAKVIYGTTSGALAIRADGFHSIADSLNNVIAFVAISLAARPPDDDHPYGHRKHEVVAAAVIGVSLLLIALDVCKDALHRLVGEATPPTLNHGAFFVLGVTWAVNVFVAAWESRAAKRLASPVLSSDAGHTRSDVAVTGGVLASVLLTRAGYPLADVVAAVVVAGFVAYIGVGILRENLGYLSDTALVEPEQVIAAAAAVPGVTHAHRVRSRGIPGQVFVDLHIHVDRDFTLGQAHHITHLAMDAIKAAVPGIADVTIHTEPDDHD